MKKILLVEGNDIAEYTVVFGKRTFIVVSNDVKDARRLTIPYEELHYPQLIDEKEIGKQLARYIMKFYESEGSIAIYCTKEYERKVFDILVWNRLDFD